METSASVIPKDHPACASVAAIAKLIAKVEHGVYVLNTHYPSKPTNAANGAISIPKTKRRKTAQPARPIEAVIIPTVHAKVNTRQPIGIAPPSQKRPKLKLQPE